MWDPKQCSQSSTSSSLIDPLELLNHTINHLSSGNISPIKHHICQDLQDAGRTTKWYYKRKAEETIQTVLEAIAPGQGLELLKMTKYFNTSDNEFHD